jgi:anti-sigma28 factor (negative regulator of flagellin synthesis)
VSFWGNHPMDPRPPESDTAHMTVLDLRYSQQAETTHRRFARDRSASMDRMDKLEQLRDRIQSGSYEVDPRAVASAIVANPSWRHVLGLAPEHGGRQCS